MAALRGLPAIGFGTFWLFCAWFVSGNGAPGPTVIGIAGLGLLFVIIGLFGIMFGFMRGAQKARAAGSAFERQLEAEEAGGPGFDADAAMARYLARRNAQGPAVLPAAASPVEPAPQVPSFGRKRV